MKVDAHAVRRGLLLEYDCIGFPNTSDYVDEVKQSTFLFLSYPKTFGLIKTLLMY